MVQRLNYLKNKAAFYPPIGFLRSLASYGYKDRRITRSHGNEAVQRVVSEIHSKGFCKIENYIPVEKSNYFQRKFEETLTSNLDFEFPCLGNRLIDPKKHSEFIRNQFAFPKSKLKVAGLTFDREDISTYSDALEKYNPSTLKVKMPQEKAFYDLWLNDFILDVVESYMGIQPYLVEAYMRRNFPSNYRVMNHNWHRDLNNKFFILKVFFFFKDSREDEGPHEYIQSSHKNFKLNGKYYYSDEEVTQNYKKENFRSFPGKKGTIIFEDTRGIHRANIPQENFRDMGYAVFVPIRNISNYFQDHYQVQKDFFEQLSKRQRDYIPTNFVV